MDATLDLRTFFKRLFLRDFTFPDMIDMLKSDYYHCLFFPALRSLDPVNDGRGTAL
jgi:hypothetical protein